MSSSALSWILLTLGVASIVAPAVVGVLTLKGVPRRLKRTIVALLLLPALHASVQFVRDKVAADRSYVVEQLKNFYVAGDPLLSKYSRLSQNSGATEEEWSAFQGEVVAWAAGASEWAKKNMSPAAGSRIQALNSQPGFIGNRRAVLSIFINSVRKNLADLIDNPAWDK